MTNAVLIRRGTIADATALAEFAARTFAESFAANTAPDDMSAHLAATYRPSTQAAELADPRVITLLALQQQAIVAFAQVRINSSPPVCVTQHDAVEVHRFYADRSTHGTGLATKLMQRAFDAAVELGGKHAWLGVWERNERALGFYRKAGFVDIGSTVYVVGSDHQSDRVLLASLVAHTGNAL